MKGEKRMPGAEVAQYGVAIFAIAMLGYVLVKIIGAPKSDNSKELVAVINNNTKALRELMAVLHQIEIQMARQETKIDELLARTRGEKDD